MKIKVIYVGKTKKSFLEEGEKEYLSRLKHYVSFEKVEISDIKNQAKMTKEQVKLQEGMLLLSKINADDIVYLLDERGKSFTSVQFADFLQKQFNNSSKTLLFLIGGAYGFSDEIYQRANGQISFSKFTFSHQMIRMILFEQLYRAMTIIKGEPYHHE